MTRQEETATGPMDDVREEGLRIARAAQRQNLPVRLLGGVAFWVRCPSARLPELARDYGDVDVIIPGKTARAIAGFLESLGYEPDKMFNALHGAQRMNFMDRDHDRPLDVLVDRFAMCHTLELRQRIALDDLTIPLADLLLTKLQVVQLNNKDLLDLSALLADHPLGEDRDSIDVQRLTEVLSADWGFEHTARTNLEHVSRFATDGTQGRLTESIQAAVQQIQEALDQSSKTLTWKIRARIGERVRWYELPEDVRH